jgi:hypothetical protein
MMKLFGWITLLGCAWMFLYWEDWRPEVHYAVRQVDQAAMMTTDMRSDANEWVKDARNHLADKIKPDL